MEQGALIAMSGGVDSSVAAYLMLRDGWRCVGATMRLYRNEDLGLERYRPCCSLEDAEDARAVADRLGIPHYVMNFTELFSTAVIDRFVRAYEAGETPNPCIDCNRYLKFDRLLRRARELGLDCVVTGHYARIERAGDRWLLRRAVDRAKDQSYVLYAMTQDQLAHTRFPLGGMTKEQTRAVAAEQGFGNARKRDSQDICFVPDGDYAAFLERRTGKTYPVGDVIDRAGHVLGQHRGAVRYTIGQRRGLGLAFDRPMYVCGKDMARNTVTLGPAEALYRRAITVGDVNWIAFPALAAPHRAAVQTRYHQTPQMALLEPRPDGCVRVTFDEPVRAAAPGQAAVFYDGDLVLGGGTIRPPVSEKN